MKYAILGLCLLATSAELIAEPLVVRVGETWLFTIDHGEPARVRRAAASASAAKGEVKVSLRSLFGTMMTISNNSPQGYSFQAQLIGADGKAVTARTCTLPPNNQAALESWPQKAKAVRLGGFVPANGGRC